MKTAQHALVEALLATGEFCAARGAAIEAERLLTILERPLWRARVAVLAEQIERAMSRVGAPA